MSGSSVLNSLSKIFKDNSPTILSGCAVTGVITTAILTAKATLKSRDEVRTAKAEKEAVVYDSGSSPEEVDAAFELSAKETVHLVWTNYIPAALSGSATIACIIGANRIGLSRNAALLGAYTLVDTAFREYKDEVLTQIGASKEQKVRDEVSRKQLERNPVSTSTVIITGGGDQLCYDTLTGRYFQSDIEKIRQTENQLNSNIIGGDMYSSLNEFYSMLDMAPVAIGDELGWNLEHLLKLEFSSHLADNGQPCLAIRYANYPRKDYGKL